jgi:hypothetical protein
MTYRDMGILGRYAAGWLGPTTPEDFACQRELCEAIGEGKLLRTIAANMGSAYVIGDCMDGRAMEFEPVAARSAGGALSLCVAAIATGLAPSLSEVAAALYDAGYPLWVHELCASNDNLAAVLESLLTRGDAIDAFRATLGLAPNRVARDEASRRLGGVTSTAVERAATFTDLGVVPDRPIGEHVELAVWFNAVRGTTADSEAVAPIHGTQGVCVDHWAFAASASALIDALAAPEDAQGTIVDFLLDYNLAVGCALGNADLILVTN